ncbi:hypothetical protein [Pseudomonas sp. 43NM1]|uniref:hypothetical protein n=1 Tax=Pseudomonas sp. 43NM1 TaxID=1904755 RepID=UPI0012FEC85F|nr:hypothetical protein [Pseudomonas sp. 43NM1]
MTTKTNDEKQFAPVHGSRRGLKEKSGDLAWDCAVITGALNAIWFNLLCWRQVH